MQFTGVDDEVDPSQDLDALDVTCRSSITSSGLRRRHFGTVEHLWQICGQFGHTFIVRSDPISTTAVGEIAVTAPAR